MYIDVLFWVINQHTTYKHDDANKILNIIWQLNMHQLVVPITFEYINKTNDTYKSPTIIFINYKNNQSTFGRSINAL